MRACMTVVCLCLLCCLAVEVWAADYAPGQLIISFKNKEDAVLSMVGGQVECMYPSVMSILEYYNATLMRRLYSGDKGAQNIYVVQLASNSDVGPAIAELSANSQVESATRNYAVEFLAEPNDWYYNHDYYPPADPDTTADQWYLRVMQADKAWNVERGSPERSIAILDQGIDFFHPDLEQNMWVNPGEDLDADGIVWDTDDLDDEDNDGNGLVDDLVGWTFRTVSSGDNYPYPNSTSEQHGTMMASVGALTDNDCQYGDTSIAGISWHCKLVSLKMGDWYVTSVIEALDYAATKGIDVVNM
jgi:thermitase